MWVLGTKSKEQFDTLHRDLQLIIQWALKFSPVDFGLSEGYRLPAKQFEYFKVGRELKNGLWIKTGATITNCDGYTLLSNHNYNPSLAFDFYAYVLGNPKLTYDKIHLTAIATTFLNMAKFLLDDGLITHNIRWGANWDQDGELFYDQVFDDAPHVELITL